MTTPGCSNCRTEKELEELFAKFMERYWEKVNEKYSEFLLNIDKDKPKDS